MRAIIDDMFFWNIEGLSIEDIDKEIIDTRIFLDNIIHLTRKSNNLNYQSYNQQLNNVQNLNHITFNKKEVICPKREKTKNKIFSLKKLIK